MEQHEYEDRENIPDSQDRIAQSELGWLDSKEHYVGRLMLDRFTAEACRTEPDYRLVLGRILGYTEEESAKLPPLSTVATRNLRLLHAAFGMQTETAEFTDGLKKHFFYGKPLDVVNLGEEVGDLSWYQRIALHALGIRWIRNIIQNVQKLRLRFPVKEGYSDGRAVTRDLIAERDLLEK